MKSWVKLYTEIIDDPDQGSLTWAQRGIWSALLALTGKLDHRDENGLETGRIDTIGRVAWHLRCDATELAQAIDAFIERGMIEIDEDGVLYAPNYPARQGRAPSAARSAVAGRVKRHRQSKHSKIFERDGYHCRYCGRQLDIEECSIDHIIPLSQGGDDDPDNLATACMQCNDRKGARTPEQAGMALMPLLEGEGDDVTTLHHDVTTLRGAVTPSDTDTDTDTDTETDAEREDPAPPAAETPANDKAKKRKKEPDPGYGEMFAALCDACHIEAKLAPTRVGKVAKGLRSAEYDADDIRRWYSPAGWWYRNDWRGQRGEPPTPEQVAETIRKAREGVTVKTGGGNGARASPRGDVAREALRAFMAAEEIHGQG